jgi:hypothetical protein
MYPPRLARAAIREEVGDEIAQPLALGLVVDPRGDAYPVTFRQVDEKAGGDSNVRRQPRTLRSERVLQYLNEDLPAFGDELVNVLRPRSLQTVLVERRDGDVGGVEEGRALEADLDEGRLHPGQHARDLALVDVADEAPAARALDVDLLEHAVLEDRRARLPARDVDEDLLLHAVPGNTVQPAERSISAVS